MDNKIKQVQVSVKKNRRNYKNAEYDDNIVEYLMKYLGCESYEQLKDLKHSHKLALFLFNKQ